VGRGRGALPAIPCLLSPPQHPPCCWPRSPSRSWSRGRTVNRNQGRGTGQQDHPPPPSCAPGQEGTRRVVSLVDGDRSPKHDGRQGCAEGTSPAGPRAPRPSSAPWPCPQRAELPRCPCPHPHTVPAPRDPRGRTRRAPSWSRSVRLLASTLNFSAQASRSSFTPTTGAVGRQGEPRLGDGEDRDPPAWWRGAQPPAYLLASASCPRC